MKHFLHPLLGKISVFVAIFLSLSTSAIAGEGFYDIYMTYTKNGSSGTISNWSSMSNPWNLGTLTSDFIVNSMYYKVWWSDWSPSMTAQIEYQRDGGATEYGMHTSKVKDSGGNNHEVYSTTAFTWAKATEYSGAHTITYKFATYFSSVNHNLPSSGTYTINYSTNAPAVSDFKVTTTSYSSGSGTSSDPYVVDNGSTLTFTASGSKAHTDGNSTLKYKFGTGSYSTTASYTTSAITSTTATSITVYGQCKNNSSSSYDGTESSQTIYYKAAAPAATYSLTVAKGTHVTTVSGSQDNITLGQSYAISATAFDTGWEFDKWEQTGGAGTASFTSSTSASTNVTITTGSVTVTAYAKEKKSAVTVSSNNTNYGMVNVASASVGVATTAQLQATPQTGYKFTTWTLTGGAVLNSGNLTDATITIKGDGNGTAGTAVATFEEDLSTGWFLAGQMNGWSTTADEFMKPTGQSSGNIGTVTKYLDANKEFKLYRKSNSKWYANASTKETVTEMTESNCTNWTFDKTDGDYANTRIKISVAGNYTFSFNTSTKQLSIIYPTSYTITYGSNLSVEPEVTSGGKVPSSTELVFTATERTGYSFDGFFKTNTYADTVTGGIRKGYTYTITPTADFEIHAKYSKINYNITYPSGGHYVVTPDKSQANYGDHIAFKVTPTDGYRLNITSSDVTISHSQFTYDYSFDMPANDVTIAVTEYPYEIGGNFQNGGGSTDFDASRYTLDNNSQHTFSLNALTSYKFKVWNENYTDYSHHYMGMTGNWEIDHTTQNCQVTCAGEACFVLKTGIAGNYTITVRTGADNKPIVDITYPQVSKLTFGGEDYAFSQVGESGVWVAGPLSLAAGTSYENNIQMIWEGTCIKNNHDNVMDVTNHTDWGMERYYSGTYYIKISTVGAIASNPDNYYFYYNPSSKKLTAEYPSYWRGDDLGWAFDHPVKWNNNVATIQANVQQNGDRKMKIVVDGQYWTNTDAAITTSTNNIQFEKDANKDKEAFKYNVASSMLGNYTFTFNRSTHQMSVGYPDTIQYDITYTDANGTKIIHAGPNGGTAIKAADKPGYKFAGWVIGPVDDKSYITVSGDDKSQQTTTVYGHKNGGTLTATYSNADFLYFKNTPGWNQVYIQFYNGAQEFNQDKGIGVGGAGNPSLINKTIYALTRIDKSDIWYLDYSSIKANISTQIFAFTNSKQDDHQYFDDCHVIYRSDFKKDGTTLLFIPENYIHKRYNKHDGKEACYYEKGYWMKYNSTESGWQIKVFDKVTGDGTQVAVGDLTANAAGGYAFKVTLNLPTSGYTYGFKLYNGSTTTWLGHNGTMTASNSTGWTDWYPESGNCGLTSTTAASYTFIVVFGTGNISVSVDYPLAEGDYRVVHTNNGKTYTTDLTYKGNRERTDTASFYYNESESSPVFKVQKCTNAANNEWEDVSDATFANPSATGVYNFVFTHDGKGNVTALNTPVKYTGNYYIRTNRAGGGWDGYKEDKDNLMEYSEFAKYNSDYDYVVCYWTESGKDVAYTIANDYSKCISDTLKDDAILGTGVQTLPANANVRFTWNSATNALSRAYLSGSAIASDRYLVMTDVSQESGLFQEKMYDAEGNSLTGEHQVSGLNEHEVTFVDKNNWVYQVDVKANPTATVNLTANYNGADRSLKENDMIIGGTYKDTKKFTLRTIYNFKTNNLITALLPDENYQESEAINADVMIIREHHEDAAQITFATDKKLDQVKTVYGVMSFDKATLNNSDLSEAERSLYWISFPYDVKLNEVFGIGTYGTHWIIEYYDGAGRAKNGFWSDSETNWKFVWDRTNYVLKANMGYVLALDLEQFGNSSTIWNNGVTEANLYFPSATPVSTITGDVVSVKLDSLPCTITRDNRNIWDSNWNLIGVPSYANRDSLEGYDLSDAEIAKNLNFYYDWDPIENKLTAAKSADKSFKAMYAYLVQYAGTIDWTKTRVDTFLVARRAAAPTTYTLQLNVAEAEKEADHLFVEFNDEYSTYFDMNKDLTKASNAGTNLYSIVEEVHVAANCLPLESGSNLVPVGIKADKKATYTFSMPQGTQGLDVQLYDIEEDKYTNLSLGNYEVYLNAGTYDDRFVLVITRSDISTQIQQTEVNGQVVKMIRNNQLYIVRDGVVYDAIGKRIEK